MSWQPIAAAQKCSKHVLLFDPTTRQKIHVGYWDKEFESTGCVETKSGYMKVKYRGAWTDDGAESFAYEEYREIHPTHWMPLPEPPQHEPKETK